MEKDLGQGTKARVIVQKQLRLAIALGLVETYGADSRFAISFDIFTSVRAHPVINKMAVIIGRLYDFIARIGIHP